MSPLDHTSKVNEPSDAQLIFVTILLAPIFVAKEYFWLGAIAVFAAAAGFYVLFGTDLPAWLVWVLFAPWLLEMLVMAVILLIGKVATSYTNCG